MVRVICALLEQISGIKQHVQMFINIIFCKQECLLLNLSVELSEIKYMKFSKTIVSIKI